jgi:integrase
MLCSHDPDTQSAPVITSPLMATHMPSRAPSLADVLAAVGSAELPERRRQDMASAVRTVCRLLDRKPEDVPADPRALALRLTRVAPLAHGLSAGRWNNVRSLFRSALDLVRPVMPGRSSVPMSLSWQGLFDQLPTKSDRARLSRLLRWLSARQIEPAAVTLDDLTAFRDELLNDSLLRNAEGTWSDCVWGWNRSAARIPGWPQVLFPKVSRKEVYVLPWSSFPASLKEDVDRWLDRLACRDFSDDGPARPARPGTLATREYQLRSFASALVHRGRDPASLTCLADLVTFDAFCDGLRFYYERNGGKSSSMIAGLAGMLKGVARHWVKTDEATLTRMAQVARNLAVPEQGLTTKNRDRLRPFDDEEMVRRLINLPLALREEADSGRLTPQRAAVLAQLAVAIELLLVAPIRRQNLAAIDCVRHLIPVGRGLHLVIPAEDVKNAVDLEFALPSTTVELLAWYQEQHRPLLAKPGCTALFPGRDGGAKSGGTLGVQVKTIVFERTGLVVNAHLFRHIGAKIFLDRQPGSYEVMRRVLGHKKMDTTTKFYAGLETAAATKHFDEVILRHRQPLREAPPANRRSRRRS